MQGRKIESKISGSKICSSLMTHVVSFEPDAEPEDNEKKISMQSNEGKLENIRKEHSKSTPTVSFQPNKDDVKEKDSVQIENKISEKPSTQSFEPTKVEKSDRKTTEKKRCVSVSSYEPDKGEDEISQRENQVKLGHFKLTQNF